ncbi:BTB/POZ DOMAIN-CONTAINING PROTEIN POB1-LIKE [Salix purpurea]|uniref:BTB/POZ DOMAIN-CONTAINING PROTEIN POB1-LIKE n=1 Tax=Salix purpurea TaxID=77065 RepID=A0A9Q0YWK7_SALPP|nr:BTB/POZ DOMAIN-CONTAINING PROTEIN POB1-LIKE [Salix purpurea]
MILPGADLFDPRIDMDSDFSFVESRLDHDFSFAFNDSNFSDRVLRIEIVADLPYVKSAGDGCSSITEWTRNRKRRREDVKKDKAVEIVGQSEEDQALTCNIPDPNDTVAYENQDLEAVAMVEGSPTDAQLDFHERGDAAGPSSDSSWSMDCSTVLRVKSIHISSAILAAKSLYFHELFLNGIKESAQRDVTIRIHAAEEEALMDLLNFMYSNNLSANQATALLDVLLAAHKFKVASCMRYCSKLLRKIPMTCESALLYLDLPSSILMAEAAQPLMDSAKKFLAVKYKDISKIQEEVLKLPLAGIEAVLSSDDLQAASEDTIYDLALKWAHTHYPKLVERKEVLAKRLVHLIRFPYMTCRKLKKVLNCNDFHPEFASKAVLEALFFKAETPHRQRALAVDEPNAVSRRFIERAYKYRPVKVVDFELPHQQCVVYLDLKRGECALLFPTGRVYSQAFHLGGQGFFLSAHCNMDQQGTYHCFGLFLGMQEKGSASFAVDYEFAARSKSTEGYVSKYKGNYTFTGGKAVGYRNLFGVQWQAFIQDDSNYFMNGILHLRAELTIRHFDLAR